MARVDNAIDINAAPAKVFGYIAEIGRQSEWVKWAKSVDVTSAEKTGIGATDQMTLQVGPQKSKVEGIVTEYKDGQMVGRRLTKGMEWFERISVVPSGTGSKVAYSVEYKPPMGPMGQMMDFLFMVRLVDQLMQDSLENLKTNLEQTQQ